MKILVAGSDANALVAALTLQKEGHQVEVLQGEHLGGISSLLPANPLAPDVANSLELGLSLQIVGRTGVSAAGDTVNLKLREISGAVSERDQEKWREFVAILNKASEIWRALFQEGPVQSVVARWREFGHRQSMEVLRLPWQSLSVLLDDWFESDLLKGTLAAAALRGSRQGPYSPGSAFLLLQRWARGEVFGRATVGLEKLKELSEAAGVLFHSDSLLSFETALGDVNSVKTKSGVTMSADVYLTTEDPALTLENRVGIAKCDPDHLEISKHWDTRSTTLVARCEPSDNWGASMVNFCSDLESLERAYDPTKYGSSSEEPFAEFDSASGLLYVQHLRGENLQDKVKAICAAHGLGEPTEFRAPSELEADFGVTGGHLFGGEKSLWQSYSLRERLQNPFSNLYLCGASTGPGDYSGVSGQSVAKLVAQLSLV